MNQKQKKQHQKKILPKKNKPVTSQEINNQKVIIAKIGAPFGVKGALKIYSYTDHPENLFNYNPIYILKDDTYIEIPKILHKEIHSKHTIITLLGCDNRDKAKEYTNQCLYVDRSQFPEIGPNDMYRSDLIGLEVIDENNKILGKVSWIMETGANDVLVIESKPNILIPLLLEQSITKIDTKSGKIYVNSLYIVDNE